MKGVGGDEGCACSGVRSSCVLAEMARWVKTCWVGLSSKLAGENGGSD